MAVDWGYTNPGVMQVWAVDEDGRIYLVHEIYQTGKTIGWWLERAREIQAHFTPECFVCDPSEPGYIAQFCRAGLFAQPANNEVRLGLQKVRERLRIASDGKPRLFVLDGSLVQEDQSLVQARKPTSIEAEFEVYAWPETPEGKSLKEIPVAKDNHSMDCLRYMVMHLDGDESGPLLLFGGEGEEEDW